MPETLYRPVREESLLNMHTKTNVRFILTVLLVGCIWLVNLGGWDLWNPDEPRYAQAAREIMETGRYFLPQINGNPYPDKPPFFSGSSSSFHSPSGMLRHIPPGFPV